MPLPEYGVYTYLPYIRIYICICICQPCCELLSPEEIKSKFTKLEGEVAPEDVIISLGGGEANRVVLQVAMTLCLPDAQFCVVGNHASTNVVAYRSWTSALSNLQKHCQTRCGRPI